MSGLLRNIMDYYEILNLTKEPFSNSPDPDFFFRARPHMDCLQKIEISLRLRRGLNVVIGDVGTGKTTLCRKLIKAFANDEQTEAHLILDPSFNSRVEFLRAICKMLLGKKPRKGTSERRMKENILNYLFRRGVEEEKIVILVIDEGQKLPDFCLELLRELLNYETNTNKLLQIVIFAQKEFEKSLEKYRNFTDRINWKHMLSPLNFKDARSMIQFRLERASEGNRRPSFFSFPAYWAVYKSTKGYPRRIINLCHRIILTLIVQNRSKVNWALAHSCAKRVFPEQTKKWFWLKFGSAATLLVMLLLLGIGLGPSPLFWKERVALLSKGDVLSALFSEPGINQRLSVVEKPSPNPGPKRLKQSGNPGNRIVEKPRGQSKLAEGAIQYDLSETENTYPTLLGEIPIGNNETLGGMIHKIYGVFNPQYLEKVIQANPQMGNPDLIDPGQKILFPSIPVSVDGSNLTQWWVEITRKERLEDAYQFLKYYQNHFTPVYMIPFWNIREGVRFSIVQEKYFGDAYAARQSLKELPEAFQEKAKILAGWEGDTVFFSKNIDKVTPNFVHLR